MRLTRINLLVEVTRRALTATVVTVTTYTKQSDVSHELYFESQSDPEIDVIPRRQKAALLFKGPGFGLVYLSLFLSPSILFIKYL